MRSTSHPDLEVAQQQPAARGLDRAASMRTQNVDALNPNSATCQRIVHQELALQWVVSSGRLEFLLIQH